MADDYHDGEPYGRDRMLPLAFLSYQSPFLLEHLRVMSTLGAREREDLCLRPVVVECQQMHILIHECRLAAKFTQNKLLDIEIHIYAHAALGALSLQVLR